MAVVLASLALAGQAERPVVMAQHPQLLAQRLTTRAAVAVASSLLLAALAALVVAAAVMQTPQEMTGQTVWVAVVAAAVLTTRHTTMEALGVRESSLFATKSLKPNTSLEHNDAGNIRCSGKIACH